MSMGASNKENKKIKNAVRIEYDGIEFRSKLEKKVYMMLKPLYDIKHEPVKYVLWKGFKPTIPFYNRTKHSTLLKKDDKKIIDITYTPDFSFTYKGHLVVIEAKGMENDVFYIKKKLFRKWLEDNAPDSIFFEVYNEKNINQLINILNELP